MKRLGLILLMIITVISVNRASAQVEIGPNLFQTVINQNQAAIDSLVEPIIQAFGIGVTGGLYHTADTHDLLGLDFGFKLVTVIIPESESPLHDTSNVSLFVAPIIQASLGLPMDFEVMARGLGFKYEDKNITLIGVGVRKNFKSHIPIPMFPDVSAGIAYHKFEAGDILSSNHLSLNLAVSKKLSFLVFSLTPYAGVGWDRTSMNFTYTWEEAGNPLSPQNIDKTFNVNTTRLTLGLDVSPFPFVHVYGDYNISKFSEVTVGAAISIR